MKTLALTLTCAVLAGCNTTHFSATRPDGTKIVVDNYRMFWSTQDYQLVLGTNSASLSAERSSPDADSLKAVAEGVTTGALKAGLKP